MRASQKIMRGLQPSTIYISEDATRAHFVDLLSMTSYSPNPKNRIRSCYPYSCYEDWLGEDWVLSAPLLDMHSLGVIILEVIAGTEVILSCRGADTVVQLIKECEEHIDKDTIKLLDRLVREHNDDLLEPYLEKVLLRQPELTARNIRSMNFAVEQVRPI